MRSIAETTFDFLDLELKATESSNHEARINILTLMVDLAEKEMECEAVKQAKTDEYLR